MLEEFGLGLCWIKSLGPGLGVGYGIQSNWRLIFIINERHRSRVVKDARL